MKIYLADDEELMLEMLERSVSEAVPDSQIQAFRNPIDLLEQAKICVPDVAFLDIQMPEIDGITLAKRLNEISPKINIVFVTGYSEYGIEAWNLNASGYVLKPVDVDSVKNAMDHLRYPIKASKPVYVKTFGNFTVLSNGKPVAFRFPKSREMFAYLIDRNGSVVTRREISAILYEDSEYSRQIQNELSRAARWMEEDLEKSGISGLLIRDGGGYRIDPETVSCDLFDFLNRKEGVFFFGEYMEQYSWAEDRKALLSK